MKYGSREHAVAIIVYRAQSLLPYQLRQLAGLLPVGIHEAVEDFCFSFNLSEMERNLIIKHNVSIPWELLELAKYKELHGNNIKVEMPPRNNQ